jgi:predicted glycosyltransferase
LDELGLTTDDRIILMRFAQKFATHDIGSRTISNKMQEQLYLKLKEIEKAATVLISTTELTLGKKFSKYYFSINPQKYRDLLAFCSLYLGEGSTSAAESGVLGVPWIFIQDLKLGNLIDQDKNYGLGYHIPDLDKALDKVKELIIDKDLKNKWRKKREKFLNDKIDVTKFLVWFIENYPDSFNQSRDNIDFQNKFK